MWSSPRLPSTWSISSPIKFHFFVNKFPKQAPKLGTTSTRLSTSTTFEFQTSARARLLHGVGTFRWPPVHGLPHIRDYQMDYPNGLSNGLPRWTSHMDYLINYPRKRKERNITPSLFVIIKWLRWQWSGFWLVYTAFRTVACKNKLLVFDVNTNATINLVLQFCHVFFRMHTNCIKQLAHNTRKLSVCPTTPSPTQPLSFK